MTIQRFQPRSLGPKTWGEELLIADTASYIGKRLTMQAGYGGPLQYHERKEETFFLHSGEAHVTFRNRNGQYESFTMQPGESVHVPPGAVHQVTAVTDCVFFEASTPVFDDRVAVER